MRNRRKPQERKNETPNRFSKDRREKNNSRTPIRKTQSVR